VAFDGRRFRVFIRSLSSFGEKLTQIDMSRCHDRIPIESVMPKRTNDFQRLVYLVRVNLAEGATVTESKFLTDRITRRKREVDVCIEGHVGGHAVMVCVECRDHKRIADVTWVDGMKAKHDRLPTNALILASRRGFTPEARTAADSCGIKTFSLEDVDQADFPKLLGTKSSLWVKSATVTAQRVVIQMPATSTLPAERLHAQPDNWVYTSDGSELCHVSKLVEMICRSRRAGDYLLSEGKEDHAWFDIEWAMPRDGEDRPLFLKKLDPETLRQIDSINIAGPCNIQITEFGMRAGKLGEIHLAWGKTDILGRDAIVVATKDTAGTEKLAVHITGMPE
jgi:hypothetical protein